MLDGTFRVEENPGAAAKGPMRRAGVQPRGTPGAARHACEPSVVHLRWLNAQTQDFSLKPGKRD